MIQAPREDKIDGLEATSVLKRSKGEKKLEDWDEKVLPGQYLRQTKEELITWLFIKLDLASEWRSEKEDLKSYSGSSESEYKNKSS